jgi:hypothetical protein
MAPNGCIDSSILLAITMRYLSGGSKYDLCPLYGISFASADDGVKYVIDAIYQCPELKIKFPTDHEKQPAIAQEFKHKSSANIDCCVGTIDSMLLWTSKPSIHDCEDLGFEDGKFYCGRKNKFGLNMMGTCDVNSRFLDLDISHPASTSDHLVFVTSSFHHRLSTPHNGRSLLVPGLCLFGDNAYVNTEFMATPYQRNQGARLTYNQDNYNFYHSQLRIRIEMAFGMLCRRFGILRRAMHPGVPVKDIIAMTMAMARIHIFCIDERETKVVVNPKTGRLKSDIPDVSLADEFDIILSGIALESTEWADDIPTELLNVGDISRRI